MTLYLTHNKIISTVKQLARKLDHVLRPKPFSLVGIAEGGVLFAHVLSSHLETSHELLFTPQKDYRALQKPIVLVDCIVDTGRTLRDELNHLKADACDATSVALLLRGTAELYPTLWGHFVLGRSFFVGFGLDDRNGKRRELPDIYIEGEVDGTSADHSCGSR